MLEQQDILQHIATENISTISILVICQEILKEDFDMFFLKKGALHHRS